MNQVKTAWQNILQKIKSKLAPNECIIKQVDSNARGITCVGAGVSAVALGLYGSSEAINYCKSRPRKSNINNDTVESNNTNTFEKEIKPVVQLHHKKESIGWHMEKIEETKSDRVEFCTALLLVDVLGLALMANSYAIALLFAKKVKTIAKCCDIVRLSSAVTVTTLLGILAGTTVYQVNIGYYNYVKPDLLKTVLYHKQEIEK